jgi:uncharacterized protein
VVEHCLNVTKVALRLAEAFRRKGYRVDLSLVEAGAILHDLGRSKTHGTEHGAVGGRIARKLGIPEEVARIVERHVGAGLSRDEAKRLGIPDGDYIPETLEEKIVTYADKLVEGDHEVDIQVTIDHFAEELGADHPAVDRLRRLHKEMVEAVGPKF